MSPGLTTRLPSGAALHRLIETRGIDDVRRLALSKADRHAIEAAAAVQAAPEADIVYAWPGAVTTLPHRNTEDHQHWVQYRDGTKFLWEAGEMDGKLLELPSGAIARRILIHFTSEAVRAEQRLTFADATLYSWCRGLTASHVGGNTYDKVREQLQRIAVSRLTIHRTSETETESVSLRWRNGIGARNTEEEAPLEQALLQCSRPEIITLRRSAILQLRGNSTAIDLYVWLASVLPTISGCEHADWDMLAERFGAGYKQKRQLKVGLERTLGIVMAVYPEAKLDLTERGFLLHASPPPILDTARRRD